LGQFDNASDPKAIARQSAEVYVEAIAQCPDSVAQSQALVVSEIFDEAADRALALVVSEAQGGSAIADADAIAAIIADEIRGDIAAAVATALAECSC
jgi:hypothetical protein